MQPLTSLLCYVTLVPCYLKYLITEHPKLPEERLVCTTSRWSSERKLSCARLLAEFSRRFSALHPTCHVMGGNPEVWRVQASCHDDPTASKRGSRP